MFSFHNKTNKNMFLENIVESGHMRRPIGFGREEEGEGGAKKEGGVGPIGFLRPREYSLSERIERIIDQKYPIEGAIESIAKELEDAYNKALKKEDEYLAFESEIKKIKKMRKFKDVVKQAKTHIENEEASEELANVCKHVGFCEYMTGQKEKGVEDMCLGIITLLAIEEEEKAMKEIDGVVSLASREKDGNTEKVLKKLFEEMVDSHHPNAIIVAGNALAEFYKENGEYTEAANVFGKILLFYQTNLSDDYIAELYTDKALPAFIECKKKAGEDVIPALLVAFDDMHHVAARNIALVYLERLKEIVKLLVGEREEAKPEERKEIDARLSQYVELFRMRKQQHKIGEEEFFINEINKILKNKKKVRQMFE